MRYRPRTNAIEEIVHIYSYNKEINNKDKQRYATIL